MKTAIVGGGAAGFFLAVNLKEMVPEMDVCIFERGQRVLRKVELSGGGRCNCTNSFEHVADLSEVYPRGHRLMKRLFNVFDHRDAYAWFERHGVHLVTQDDACVFPASQDAHTITGCFLDEAHRLGTSIRTGSAIESLSQLRDYDFIAVTTGGCPKIHTPHSTLHPSHSTLHTSPSTLHTSPSTLHPSPSTHHTSPTWPLLEEAGVELVEPVPSLFTFNIADDQLRALMGIVSEATVMIPGTKMKAQGPLLITHWGMSGPAILRLSSYGARLLHENHYRLPLAVNWTGLRPDEVLAEIQLTAATHPQKKPTSVRPFGLTGRLWEYLVGKSLGHRATTTWAALSRKELNRLANTLTNDEYQIAGRAPFKDEFVTCGGIALSSVNASTLESKSRPGLYFAGEVLDIDGVTGGFNFQAAWTTAYVVASSIARKCKPA